MSLIIGERIKKQRKLIKLTQEEFASKIGLADRSLVSKWERGEQLPTTDRIPAICTTLECDADYLFGFIDFPRHETTDIQATTGLSEVAIEHLIHAGERKYPFGYMDIFHVNSTAKAFISDFIASDEFSDFVFKVSASVNAGAWPKSKIPEEYTNLTINDIKNAEEIVRNVSKQVILTGDEAAEWYLSRAINDLQAGMLRLLKSEKYHIGECISSNGGFPRWQISKE